ncbi:class I SAM-dependent methyltransferase [Halomonas sp. SpR1]|uniref:class I SAM-dependent methyltransferase n=1 Tax=Halomonas sp. SpR1 TaxID=3050462 RepID=UPI0027E44689|nr:class I SAM-dependent methyltransferase [Halomonas sp. SpR1]MDQ7733395.1 class I SAM-dependent methyltransferase [Halomonas sp. SpR1]
MQNNEKKMKEIDAVSLEKKARSYNDKEEYLKAIEIYHCLLGDQSKTIDLIVAKAQALRNQHRLHEAVALLEQSVQVGVFNSKTLHVLAAFYRDKKCWGQAERCIWDIIKFDQKYSELIGFASFASDILRKQGYVNTAYSFLASSIFFTKSQGKNIPLTALAIQKELEYESSSEYSIEVSYRFYDAVYENSDKYASSSDNSIYVPAWNAVLQYFQDNEFLSVVDIGCGPGQFAEFAIKRLPSLNYTGFDYSSVAISQAKNRTKGAEFIEGNAFSSPLLTENAADVYILLEVLEHIEKDLDLLGSMPSRASVVFSVPNFDSFGHVRFFLDENEVYDRYNHLFSSLEVKGVILKGYSTIYLAFGQLK